MNTTHESTFDSLMAQGRRVEADAYADLHDGTAPGCAECASL